MKLIDYNHILLVFYVVSNRIDDHQYSADNTKLFGLCDNGFDTEPHFS